ncbi:MAG: hypothetical protein R3F59_13175 [Myxococcota bacterium]
MPNVDRPEADAPPEAWLVYADALQASDDPWGELVVLNHAVAQGADPAERNAYLVRHVEAILGPLAAKAAHVEIEWHYALPRAVDLRIGPKEDGAALVKALLASPLAPDLERLRLVGVTPSTSDRVDLSAAVAALADLPARCTAVELVDERATKSRMLVSADYDAGDNLVSFGPLEPLWRVPHLEHLRIDVADPQQLQLGTIDAPALRSFALYGLAWGYVPSGVGRALAAARWPQLQSLSLRLPETFTYSWPLQFGAYAPLDRYAEPSEYDEYGDDDGWNEDVNWGEELGPIFAALKDGKLERLSLTGFASARQLLQALVDAIPASVTDLDLSGSNVDSGDLEFIAQHAPTFSRLKTIDLTNTLAQDASALSALGPEIRHKQGRGSIYEFAVGME